MDVQVNWQGKMAFTGTNDNGFALQVDTDPSVGGDNDGFRPLELMALSLAGCTAMDVISILKKKQQEVTEFKVKVHADQQTEHPHVFTNVVIEYIVSGRNVRTDAVERSIELSKTKYCAAIAMLSKALTIEYTYRIIEAA